MSRVWIVAIYSFLYLATSLFLPNTVIMQTVYNLAIISIIVIFIVDQKVKDTKHRFIKNILLFFWIGQAFLFVYNIQYSDFDMWLSMFNNYIVLIPVYLVALAGAIIYTFVWKR